MTAHVLLQHAELTAELIAFPSAYYTSAALYLGKKEHRNHFALLSSRAWHSFESKKLRRFPPGQAAALSPREVCAGALHTSRQHRHQPIQFGFLQGQHGASEIFPITSKEFRQLLNTPCGYDPGSRTDAPHTPQERSQHPLCQGARLYPSTASDFSMCHGPVLGRYRHREALCPGGRAVAQRFGPGR